MAEREKVIDGLMCLAGEKEMHINHCDGCGYNECKSYVVCIAEIARDALSLLKAQEPRVMTLEELDAIYQTKKWHTWPFNTPPYLWMTVNPDVRQTRGFWICWRDIMYSLENNSPFYVRENYGKVWKILTAEPTDEQREAIPWEPPKEG